MDPNIPRREDDLSEVEHRLARWQPAAGNLDADAVLFAAGRAAGRRGQGHLFWPVAAVFLAVQAAGFGVWGMSERAERQALASQLQNLAPQPHTFPTTDLAMVPDRPYEPSPGDYLSTRRQMEQDPNGWLASLQPAGPQAPGPPPAGPAILTPRQRDGLFSQ